jgi:hypothetical protein
MVINSQRPLDGGSQGVDQRNILRRDQLVAEMPLAP